MASECWHVDLCVKPQLSLIRVKQTCLSEKSDWFLSHGVAITDVCPDDFSEGLLGSLGDKNTHNHIHN